MSAYKGKLVRIFVDGRLSQQLFDEQLSKVEADLAEVQGQEVEILPEEEELSELLVFSRWVLENAGVVWSVADYEKKGRLQGVFFPSGLTVTEEGFGTPTFFNFFKQFERDQDDIYGLASPGGFEPPLPP